MLDSIFIGYLFKHDVPWVIAILPQVAKSLNKLNLLVAPTLENFDSFPWKCLDVVLLSWFLGRRMRCDSRLGLHFHPTDGMDSRYSVESLFPLATSLGKDKWCEFRTW